MKKLIKSIFENFMVGDNPVPISFLFYDGDSQDYVTYMQTDIDNSMSCDDELVGYVEYYDFDVYTHKNGLFGGDYTDIVESIKKLLKENGFVWQPSRSSADMYETDTGYYHKTLNFAILKEE